MVLQRKRSSFVGLGLTVALVLAVALPATASAQSTLDGELLEGFSGQGNSATCPNPGFSGVSGLAQGPYPGTFTETGSFNYVANTFSATFTIISGTTTITGSKSGQPGVSCGGQFGDFFNSLASYTATIHTPNGAFHDEGEVPTEATIDGSTGTAILVEGIFISSLAQPVPIPTSKDQCKKGGWKNFPQFKNQGQCEKSVKA